MHPILLKIGPVTLYSWGLFVALGVAAAVYLIYKNARREGFNPDQILDGTFWTILAGFIGGRIAYVVYFWRNYQAKPWEVFFIWQGGLAFLGGLGLGLLTAVIYCRKKKINFLKIMDLVAPYAALAYGIGRIGCFLNGCCEGKICTLPWAVHFPNHPGLRHPTQLYSVFFGLALFALLLFLQKIKKSAGPAQLPTGQIFYNGIMAYCFYRFFLEYLRNDPPYFLMGLNIIQIICALTYAVLAGIYFYRGYKTKKNN